MPPTRVVNVKSGEPYDVYIGRAMLFRERRLPASKWANPYKITATVSREESIRRYRARLLASPELLGAPPELRGKVLACWCKEHGREVPCHGDVLAELADAGGQDEGERVEG